MKKGFQENVRPHNYPKQLIGIVVEAAKAVEETMNPSGH